MMKKILKIDGNLAYVYSSESTQREPSKEYQHDRVERVFKKSFALDERSLSVGRVNHCLEMFDISMLMIS